LASPLLLNRVKDKPQEEERTMKKKLGTVVMTGALVVAIAFPLTAIAGPAGKGGARVQKAQTQTRTTEQIRARQRLRDGSCLDPATADAGTKQKKGSAYGPGDGTGNLGDRPLDGTGYGAPSQR